MTKDELVALAKRKAVEHKIDPALVCAVCEHESGGWNPWAVRMEPAFYERYTKPMTLTDTEEYNRAQSFGLMQVMGQTAREFGFKGKYLTELCDPETGIEYGCRKLRECLDKRNGDIRVALLRYNGGGNKSYPDMVLKLIDKYVD